MKLWSIAFAYRLGLGFHALNNEGADGSNLMQPRRIDVGNITYDGISGEIIRHHILENYVNKCRQDNISMLPMSEGLHPDRGPIGIRAAAKQMGFTELTKENLYSCTREALKLCAVIDAGGYLAAWKSQDAGGPKKDYVAEQIYIEKNCVPPPDVEPIKRESCFDVAWLISQEPQELTVTQHSAYRDTFNMNSRYAQTMRSNIYGGVIRADLHRIGTDDYWYLQNEQPRMAITYNEQKKRQKALVTAIADFIASPTGAKVAAWAPHVFLIEGAILLTSSRTAPFSSPIAIDVRKEDAPIKYNDSYAQTMKALENGRDAWYWEFKDIRGLLDSIPGILSKLEDTSNATEEIKKEQL